MITTAISLISVAVTATEAFKRMSGKSDSNLKKAAVDLGKDFMQSDSLISFTKSTRVEPIVLVDSRAVYIPFLPDVMQSLTSLFSAYYLQAVALTTTVGSVSVLKTLDKLSPNRAPMLYSQESFKDKLPTFSMEADKGGSDGKNFNVLGKDAINTVKESANLSVGKLLEVKLVDGDNSFVIPVSVRLMANVVDTRSLTHILGVGKDNKSFKERWYGWKSGELTLVRDLMLCQDLIAEHRRTLKNDKSGVYAEIMKRRNNNAMAALASQDLSVATASNITVITTQTQREVETEIGGRLSDFKVRERVFKDTYTMLLVVVDPDHEQITIYHRGIALPTDLSAREIKYSNKSGGPDVAEILKAYQLGNNPSF